MVRESPNTANENPAVAGLVWALLFAHPVDRNVTAAIYTSKNDASFLAYITPPLCETFRDFRDWDRPERKNVSSAGFSNRLLWCRRYLRAGDVLSSRSINGLAPAGICSPPDTIALALSSLP